MPAATAVPAHRRHDISGQVWEILEPLLPGGKGKTAGPLTITASFSMLCSGFCAPALPGGTCPRTTGTGRTLTAASAAGGTGAYGQAAGRHD